MIVVPAEVAMAAVIVAAIAAIAYRVRGEVGRRELEVDAMPAPLPVIAVKTRTDAMITGRLRSRDELVLVVAGAIKLDAPAQAGGPPVAVPLDGDVVIPWANVDYWQEGLPAELLNREP